ncbi:MAG: AAA family ATPase [Anaerolineales bacterium]|nr:AAA family ATPase [Anaerolineales bacterium]
MNLLEREPHLQSLSAALAEAAAGSGRLVLVSGEAGLGKSTLVDHFVRRQTARARVLWGACDALFTPRPFGPLYDMAGHFPDELPALLEAGPPRTAIFTAVLAELQRRLTIAVFEDVHWADEATLDLLKFLGRRVTRTQALIVLTYRDDELGPTHPLRVMLGDLATSSAVRRLPLAPLSEHAARTLAGGRTLDPVQLHRQTGGNPFFITEVVANQAGGIPATVRDAVLARAARLSPSALAVLQAAAVIGPRIEPQVLAEVTGAEAGASEECLAAGMVVAHGNLLAFRHELARQAVFESLSPVHRLALHRLTLAALEAAPAARGDLRRLAYHAEAAGEVEATLTHAPAAARQAASAGAHREAAALYRLALRFADQAAPRERAGWLEAYAEELHTLGALEESVAVRRQAIQAWQAAAGRAQEGLSQARLAVTLLNIGQPAQAQQASQSALDLLQALPPGPELAWAQRTQAHLLMLNRDCAGAIACGSQAVELAERFNQPAILARAYTTVGAAWLVLDYPRGRALLEKAQAVARSIEWEFGVANVFANLGSISCEVFALRDAAAYLQEGRAYTGDRDLDFLGKYMAGWQALTFVYLGRWAEAERLADEARHGAGVTAIGRIPALVALGRLRARQGEADPWPLLDEALELAQQSQTVQRLSLVQTARAEAAWLAGDRGRALAEARAVSARAAAQQHAWFGGEAAYWLWRAGEQPPAVAGLAAPYAHHLAGDWRAAAAEWDQRACPFEQARALAEGDHAAQVMALALLDRLGARPAAAQLRDHMRAAGAARVPKGPRAATRENPFGLTERQVEILALLGEGLTNGEIAARLHISTKTAEHHVGAILTKLNVHSREAAAHLARTQSTTKPT